MTERERFDAAMADEAYRNKALAVFESIEKSGVTNPVDVMTQALLKLGYKVTREEIEAAQKEAGVI